QRLAPALDGVRTTVVAQIDGLPEATETGWRFALDNVRLLENDDSLPPIRVHWFDGLPVSPGELWRFEITLRRPAGMANPGGFDYEAWLYAHRVGALGSIRHFERFAEAPRFSRFVALRQDVHTRMAAALAELVGGGRLLLVGVC